MNTKELTVGCDEFTLVLRTPEPVQATDWLQSADEIIEEFLARSQIEAVLGELVPMTEKLPAGYTQGWTIKDCDYYFAIAAHEHFPNMGIAVRFSAHSWAIYQKKYSDIFNEEMNVYVFLQMIQSDIYKARLSRIDITADYKQYGYDLKPNTIYNRYVGKEYRICDCNGKYANHTFESIEKNGCVNCFYIGSRKANTRAFMRVYDKRLEQIQTSGFRLQEALECENWTRFEVSYRQSYAHEITEQLINLTSSIELSNFLAAKITDKYRFVEMPQEEYTEFTDDLLDIVQNKQYSALRYEAPKNYALTNSIRYIVHGAGLLPLLFKIEYIWGEDGVKEFIENLLKMYEHHKDEFYKDYKIKSWLLRNASQLKQQTLADCFMGINKKTK